MDTKTIVMVVKIIILVFLLVQAYMMTSVFLTKREKIAGMAKKSIDVAIGRSKSGYFSSERITADLSKYGMMFMLRDYNLEPSTFIAIKIGMAFLVGLIGVLLSTGGISMVLFFAIGAVVGFFSPDLIMRMSNSEDNEAMLDDILTIYTILKLHARAGAYITDSLIECQRSVSNLRLKQALNEMNNNILSSRITLEEAVDQFNARFSNEQIDNLSVIIKQAVRTGRSVDLLDDLSKQIEANNNLRIEKKKDKLKRQIALTQVMFFSLISALIIYLVAMELAVSLGSL